MGHLALYRQFRPISFDDVVEQAHAVSALRQSITTGQIAHAYLFCGTHGTGKTSLAKLFARGINCREPINGSPCNTCDICKGILDNTLLDVIEMDAASNNSVDNIRRICEEVMFLPSVAKYKVYIVDEVHMLSGGAFNALLKTLEEPPAHAVFLLATTEPHRIPATILSRCQRYDFRRIPLSSIVERLRKISDELSLSIDEEALLAIANLSDGALRDAISLLDQVSTSTDGQITREDILTITGVVDDGFLLSMASAILHGDAAALISYTRQLMADGRDIPRFTLDLAHTFRNLLVLFTCPQEDDLLQVSSKAKAFMQTLLSHVSGDELIDIITRLSALIGELKWTPDVKTAFEITLLSFCKGKMKIAQAPSFSETSDMPSAVMKEALPVVEKKAPPPVPVTPTIEETVPVATITEKSEDIFDAPILGNEEAPILEAPPIPVFEDAPVAPDIPLFENVSEKVLEKKIEEAPEMTAPLSSNLSFDDLLPPPPAPFSSPPEVEKKEIPESIQEIKEDTDSEILFETAWKELLHYWQDALFIVHLQLKKASVFKKDQDLHIVFPDAMGNYAKNLTQTADYTTINKDILKKIPQIQKIQIHTQSAWNDSGKSGKAAEENTQKPQWMEDMIRTANQAGIIVETPEQL